MLKQHDFPMPAQPVALLGVDPVAREVWTGWVQMHSQRQVKTTLAAVEMSCFGIEQVCIHHTLSLPHETVLMSVGYLIIFFIKLIFQLLPSSRPSLPLRGEAEGND